jgi:chromosome segregation ATPase
MVSIDDAIFQQLAGMTEQMEDQQREKDDATKQLTESAVKLDSERRAKDNAIQQLAESTEETKKLTQHLDYLPKWRIQGKGHAVP